MTKLMGWLIQSSADPDKVALTVKGILTGFIPLIFMVLQIVGHPLPNATLDDLIVKVSAVVSVVLTLVGLVRKIYLTFKTSP